MLSPAGHLPRDHPPGRRAGSGPWLMTHRGPRGGAGCSAPRHVREGLRMSAGATRAPTPRPRPPAHPLRPGARSRQGARAGITARPGRPRLLPRCCIMHHAAPSGSQNGLRGGAGRVVTGLRAHPRARPALAQPGDASAPAWDPRHSLGRPPTAPRSAEVPSKVTQTRGAALAPAGAGHSPSGQAAGDRRRARPRWTD